MISRALLLRPQGTGVKALQRGRCAATTERSRARTRDCERAVEEAAAESAMPKHTLRGGQRRVSPRLKAVAQEHDAPTLDVEARLPWSAELERSEA